MKYLVTDHSESRISCHAIRKGIESKYAVNAVSSPLPLPTSSDYERPPSGNSTLSEFTLTNRQEIEDILKESDFKCAPNDILPADLFKDNISSFIDVLVELVNISLRIGSVDGVKHADVIPLFKEP